MSKPAAPPPPDYVGAAKEQAASSAANTAQSVSLNRPDIYTPLGSQTWTQNSPDKYTQNVNLTDAGQKLFDSQNQTSQMMADTANQSFGRAQDALGTPLDLSSVGGGQEQVQKALYDRSASMLDPQFQQQEASERDRLANSGFQVGTEGFDKAMGNFNRSKAMAYGDARDRAIVGGQDARKQAIQEALLQRQTPLNELSALRSGTQVTQPQFQATTAAPTSETAQMLNATNMAGQNAQAGYGTAASMSNANTAALGSMAGMGAMAMF